METHNAQNRIEYNRTEEESRGEERREENRATQRHERTLRGSTHNIDARLWCNLITNNFGSINHIPYVCESVRVRVLVRDMCVRVFLATNYKFQLCTECALLHKTPKIRKDREWERARDNFVYELYDQREWGGPWERERESRPRVAALRRGLMEPIRRAKALAQTIDAWQATMSHIIERMRYARGQWLGRNVWHTVDNNNQHNNALTGGRS